MVLRSFELLTGLKINFAKSKIYGVCYDGDLKIFFYFGSLPTTYLGLYLGDKCGGIDKWDKIIEKFIARLPGWKKTLLSRAGKFTLINSVLVSLTVYYMPLYEILVSVINKLQETIRDILWHNNKGRKKIHPVKWNALCTNTLFLFWSWH